MTLREKQSLFVSLLGKLFTWVDAKPGWSLTLGEGRIGLTRIASTPTDERLVVTDRVHMEGSLHYSGLAQDLNLFVGNVWVNDGGDPRWTEIGVFWESLHPLCRWGGRFHSVDSNHFSVAHAGKA